MMANYVDGFVLPVPRKKLAAYRRMAREAGEVWRELGALAYVEATADDVKPGKWTSFPQSVKLNIIYSNITENTSNGTKGIYKSVDDGATWTKCVLGNDINGNPANSNFHGNQGWYDQFDRR